MTLPPPSSVEPVTEVLHGVRLTDPYRWLEDQNSAQTRTWLKEQTTYTRAYVNAVPNRDRIRERVQELLSVPSVAEPWSIGDRYFYLKRLNGGEQPAIMVREGACGEETVLVDPCNPWYGDFGLCSNCSHLTRRPLSGL